jgi:hypothetical protein
MKFWRRYTEVVDLADKAQDKDSQEIIGRWI